MSCFFIEEDIALPNYVIGLFYLFWLKFGIYYYEYSFRKILLDIWGISLYFSFDVWVLELLFFSRILI